MRLRYILLAVMAFVLVLVAVALVLIVVNNTAEPSFVPPVFPNKSNFSNASNGSGYVLNNTGNGQPVNNASTNGSQANGSGVNGSAIVNDTFQPIRFIPVSLQEYRRFYSNDKISAAIGELTTEERQFLETTLLQVENNDTVQWSEFDTREIFLLTREEWRRIWLRRVAFSLFQELHNNTSWRLLDYSNEELRHLLSFCVDTLDASPGYAGEAGFAHYECQTFLYYNLNGAGIEPELIFEPNPIRTHEISLQVLNSTQARNKRELLDNLILQLRSIGWGHVGSLEDFSYLMNGRGGMTTTLERLYTLKRGGSGWNSVFLAAMVRSWNVPAHVGAINGHGYVRFPTEDIGLYSGDFIQGWPNGLPIEMSYFSNNQFNYLFRLPVCVAHVEADKLKLRRMFSVYNNETINDRTYYGARGYCELGAEFVEKYNSEFTKSTDEECIAGSQPAKGQWRPSLSTDEANQWQQLISSYAIQNNKC